MGRSNRAKSVVKTKPCPECGGTMKLEIGWESKEALVCRECGEYEYWVYGVKCVKTARFEPIKEQSNE